MAPHEVTRMRPGIPEEKRGELDRVLSGVQVNEYPISRNTGIELERGRKEIRYVVGVDGSVEEKWVRTGSSISEKPKRVWWWDRRRVGRILEAHRALTDEPVRVERDWRQVGGHLVYVGKNPLGVWEKALDKVVREMLDIAPVGLEPTQRTIKDYLEEYTKDPKKLDPKGSFRRNIFTYAARQLGYLDTIQVECIKEVAYWELVKKFMPQKAREMIDQLGKNYKKEGRLVEESYVRAGYSRGDLWQVKTV